MQEQKKQYMILSRDIFQPPSCSRLGDLSELDVVSRYLVVFGCLSFMNVSFS